LDRIGPERKGIAGMEEKGAERDKAGWNGTELNGQARQERKRLVRKGPARKG
jgi:hypothetical protein